MTKVIVAFRNFPNAPRYDTDPRKSTILELLIDFWRNAMTYLLPENATFYMCYRVLISPLTAGSLQCSDTVTEPPLIPLSWQFLSPT